MQRKSMSASLIKGNKYVCCVIKEGFFLNFFFNTLVEKGGCINQQQCHTHMEMITVTLAVVKIKYSKSSWCIG